MTPRPLPPALPCLLLLLLLGAGGCAEGRAYAEGAEDAARRAGDPVPAVLVGEGAALTVTWLLREADCLSCEAAPVARGIRRIQRRFGDRVEVRVVAVGAFDPEVEPIHALLRRERIAATVTRLSRSAYERDFGSARLPEVYLSDGERILERIGPSRAIAGDPPDPAAVLERMVERLLLQDAGRA